MLKIFSLGLGALYCFSLTILCHIFFHCSLPVPNSEAELAALSTAKSSGLLVASIPLNILPQIKTKKIKTHRCSPAINSPASLEIDEDKTTKEGTLHLNFGQDIQTKTEDVRAGTKISLEELLIEHTDEVHAQNKIVVLSKIRQLKNTPVLCRDVADIQKYDAGWQEILLATRRRIRAQQTTQVRYELNTSEKKEVADVALGPHREKSKPNLTWISLLGLNHHVRCAMQPLKRFHELQLLNLPKRLTSTADAFIVALITSSPN
jgi:hypothetical protein